MNSSLVPLRVFPPLWNPGTLVFTGINICIFYIWIFVTQNAINISLKQPGYVYRYRDIQHNKKGQTECYFGEGVRHINTLSVAISDHAFVDNEMVRKYNFGVCSTAHSLQLHQFFWASQLISYLFVFVFFCVWFIVHGIFFKLINNWWSKNCTHVSTFYKWINKLIQMIHSWWGFFHFFT